MIKFIHCIGLLILVLLTQKGLSAKESATEEGYQRIFDGKTLEGWEGKEGFWRVEDGTITGETTKKNALKGGTYLIWRKGKVADFELKLEYCIQSKWANSGIQYRSEEVGTFDMKGYQADLESGPSYTGINYGVNNGRKFLANRGQKVWLGDGQKKNKIDRIGDAKELQKHVKGQGEWNAYHIIAKGNHLIHKINGKVLSETIDESKKDARFEGLIGLQLHQGPPMKIQFKNIRVKHLKLEKTSQENE